MFEDGLLVLVSTTSSHRSAARGVSRGLVHHLSVCWRGQGHLLAYSFCRLAFWQLRTIVSGERFNFNVGHRNISAIVNVQRVLLRSQILVTSVCEN